MKSLFFFKGEKEPDKGYRPGYDIVWYDDIHNMVFVRNAFGWEIVLEDPKCNVWLFYEEKVKKYYDKYELHYLNKDGSGGTIGIINDTIFDSKYYVIKTNNSVYVFKGYHQMIISIRKDKDYEFLIRGLIDSEQADVFECLSKNKFCQSKKINEKILEDLSVPYYNVQDMNYSIVDQ